MAEKKPLCDFGKQIEIALIQKDKTNDWLIEKVKEDTGRYFDRSYLFKVKTGKLETPGIKKSICRILNIQDGVINLPTIGAPNSVILFAIIAQCLALYLTGKTL